MTAAEKVFEDSALKEEAVIQNFRKTAADGKTYDTQHDNPGGYEPPTVSPLATSTEKGVHPSVIGS